MRRKWTIEDIRRVLKECDDKYYQYNSKAHTLPIKINSRLVTTLGRFFYEKQGNRYIRPVKFDFNKVLFEGKLDDNYIRNVVIHEYCHYIVNTITGRPIKHGREFKLMCVKLGIPPSAYTEHNEDLNKNIDLRYELICSKCRDLIGQRVKLNREFIDNSVSSCCNASIVVKDLRKQKTYVGKPRIQEEDINKENLNSIMGMFS